MIRALTNDEKKLTNIGLEKNKRELKEIKENQAYNQDLLDKQEYLRKFDDKWRDFLRQQKKKEDDSILKTISDEINNKEQLIKIAEDHIKNGVEVKESVLTK